MKVLVCTIGVVALLAGLLFAGQGAGYIHWPATSTMISDVHWVYYGVAIAVIGLVLIVLSRRRKDLRPL